MTMWWRPEQVDSFLERMGDPTVQQQLLTFQRTFEGRFSSTYFRLLALCVAPRDGPEDALRNGLLAAHRGLPSDDQLMAAAAFYTVQDITSLTHPLDDPMVATLVAYLHTVYAA